MNVLFQLLSEQEIPRLVDLMRAFYAQQHMRFDESAARKAVEKLLAEPALGQICLVYRSTELAGYFVLTFCYSLEFHGTFGLLDEVYLRDALRGQGLGHAILAFAENVCRQKAVKAIRLEVGRENEGAQRLYRASGFVEDARFLFTKWL